MENPKKEKQVHWISVQGQTYFYNIFNNINKFKILLIFINKGFSWYREISSLGINNYIINETLEEMNNLGLIQLKELRNLDNIEYEAFKKTRDDLEHYFKIYYTTEFFLELTEKFNQDINYLITNNPHLENFIKEINLKFKPFLINFNKINYEENTLLKRKITMNGVTFEKETKNFKDIKLFLNKKSTNLVLREQKPLSLLNETEIKRLNNKVTYNQILKDEDYINDEQAEKDFNDGFIGKSEVELEIERENKDKDIFNLLGIEEE